MKRIEEYIELANKAVENISYPAEPNGLYEPIRYGMAQGGKRLRPALLLAACDAAGVEAEKAMKQAAAIEMFHNFTLLHDDVMDKATCAEENLRYATNGTTTLPFFRATPCSRLLPSCLSTAWKPKSSPPAPSVQPHRH